jgi:antitoxin (DNA-binding transcriptional repressor) of toxin-antitoxin stability system
MSKTVAAEEFEAHPGELLREAKQEELVVMEDGEPLATVIPAKWPVDISAGRRNALWKSFGARSLPSATS